MADNTVTFRINLKDEASAVFQKIGTAFSRGADEINSAFDEMQGKMRNFEMPKFSIPKMDFTQVTMMSQALQGMTTALNGMLAPSKAFDTEMRKANTMMGLSATEFEHMKDEVRALSREIPMSGDALAQGLYQIISTGTPASEAIDMLRASARSSVGGIADLQKVVGVTATMLKNYGLQGGDAAQMIQDKIQLTAKNGVTSFEQLSEALPRVAGTAATLGVSIDELMASFATLTGVSGNTAEVATQMRSVLSSLVKPSSQAATLAEQMGFKFDAMSIQAAGGLDNFLKALKISVQGYASESGMLESEIYATLFGSAEAVAALTPLQGELSDKLTENISLMVDSAGTIDEAYNIMGETAENKGQLMQNVWATVTDFVNDKIGGIVGSVGTFLNYGSQLAAIIPIIQTIGSSAAFAAIKTNAVAIATNVWTVAQTAFNIVASLNPIGLIVIAIGALIAGIALCIKYFDKFKEVMKIVGLFIFDTLINPITSLLDLLSNIPGVGKYMGAVSDKIKNFRASLTSSPQPTSSDAQANEPTTSTDNSGVENALAALTTPKGLGDTVKGKSAKATGTNSASGNEGKIKNININIDKVVESFSINTTNLKNDLSEVRNLVAKALIDSVNDVNYAL